MEEKRLRVYVKVNKKINVNVIGDVNKSRSNANNDKIFINKSVLLSARQIHNYSNYLRWK